MKLIILIAVIIGGNFAASARVVNSPDDEIRILAFPEHLQELSRLEQKRLSDVGDIKTEKLQWEREQAVNLEIYRQEKAKQARSMDESGPEYQDHIESKLQDYREQEKVRHEFVDIRDVTRERERRHVGISEESEYFIAANTPRVDWRKRKFSETSGKSSGSGAPSEPNFGGFNNNGYVPPPPNTGFYEAPPPPPPPIPYEPQNWEIPPPPPPPSLFEEENPF